jgi:hypothetical protein
MQTPKEKAKELVEKFKNRSIELGQRLSTIEDQDITVMVRGYRGGVGDIIDSTPAITNVALNVNQQWYYGEHEVQNFDHEYKDKQIVNAIILR